MTLTAAEQAELQQLLWQTQIGHLQPWQEQRLRGLVAKQNPAAQGFPLAQLVTAGLVALGAILLLRALVRD